MWTTSELITAAAFGIAFGSAFVACCAAFIDKREREPERPYARFYPPKRRSEAAQLALNAPQPIGRRLEKIAAGLAAILGRLSG